MDRQTDERDYFKSTKRKTDGWTDDKVTDRQTDTDRRIDKWTN